MFDWNGSARRKDEVSVIAVGLPNVLPSLHPVERASVLLLANLNLDLASRLYGQQLYNDPGKLTASAVDRALKQMLAVRSAMSEVQKEDVSPRHTRVYALALELAIATIGVSVIKDSVNSIYSSWKIVWADRANLRRALVWLRRWELSAGVPAFPPKSDGGELSDPEVLKLAARVPGFLVQRSKGR